MTQYQTPGYQITYADDLEPLANYPALTQAVAQTVEAALIRGGVAPPNAASLAAEAATRAAADTALSNRVGVLEADTGWVTLASNAGWGSTATGLFLQYRKRGSLVQVRGNVSGTGISAFAQLPVGFRPTKDLYQSGTAYGNSPLVIHVGTDGQLFPGVSPPNGGLIFWLTFWMD